MNLRPLSVLVPLALCAALLVGCGDDSDPEAGPSDEASTSATAAPSASPTETTEATGFATSDPDEEPTSTESGTVDPDDGSDDPLPQETDTPSTPVPDDAAELCAAFSGAYDALIKTGPDFTGEDDEKVPAELVDAFRTWGQDLADAELPSDFTAEQRSGVKIMSRALLAIPDNATGKDLDAIDGDLSTKENKRVESVTDYVDATCDLDF